MSVRRNKWKSSVALLMAVAAMSGQALPAMAAEVHQENVSLSTEGLPAMNYMPVEDVEPVAAVTRDGDYDGDLLYATPETRYNPLDEGMDSMPTVRNQSPYGSCWAFASLSPAEIMTKRQGTEKDLSELHLAYFSYNTVNDPLGGLSGDSNACIGDNFMERGGNMYFSGKVLANWIGAADESAAPYDSATDAIANGLDSSIAYEDSMHLQGAYIVSLSEDADLVKEYIKKYGGVGVAYGHYSDADFYNEDNYAYYCDQSASANHAVTVVGWDDNFAASNFSLQPEGNGAWLIRNSWGGEGYGQYGYFWLSYYDMTLDDSAYAFVFESADNYDHNYQYDGAMYESYLGQNGSITTANIFKPAVYNGNGEVLSAVGISVGSVNTDYTIQVYTNLNDGNNPESGELVSKATTTGKTTAEGYYTIPLNYPVTLRNGAAFAVVVTLTKDSDRPYMGMERSTTGSWYQIIANAESGQSFVKVGNSWLDYGDEYNRNIKIKAFTEEVENLPYSDVDLIEGNWKYESIKYVTKKGMMNAITGTDQFMPDRTLSRGMFVTVLYRLEGNPNVSWQDKFSDVVSGKWYSNAVIWAADKGIVNGYGDGSFGVDTNITREQIAKMLYLYAREKGYNVSTRGDLSAYTDTDQVNGWAWEYMQWAVGVGMISGKPNGDGSYRLDPKGEATRAECAAMLMRFADKYGN